MPENYVKEKSFGLIDQSFYDFEINYNLCDVTISGWPEKYVISQDKDPVEAIANVLEGAREIIRDLTTEIRMHFIDVYSMQVHEEGWESWGWNFDDVPRIEIGKHPSRSYPILKIENSNWIEKIVPVWNRDWMDQVSHWRLISTTNSVDICARSATGKWISHPE